MYAISSDNGRRASQPGPQRPELPILFHLMDVSRPRAKATDALAARTGREPSKPEVAAPVTTAPAATSAAPTSPLAEAQPLPPIATAAPALPAPRSDGAAETIEFSDPFSKSIRAAAKSTPEKTADAKVASTSANEIVPLEIVESASPPTAAVTLKSKVAERRQRRTPASEDWFAAHGKFLAIAFVAALIGTVYFARTNRQQASPAKAETATQSPLADHSEPATPSATKSVNMVAAVSDSKIELQAPTAPPLIATAPAGEKSSAADKLFDFPASAKTEQRIAARPVTTTTEVKTDQPSTSAEAASAPALAPAYPVTTSPAAYPSAGPPPVAYQQTTAPPQQGPIGGPQNYRSEFPAQSYQQPAPQQPASQQPPPQQPNPQQPNPQQPNPQQPNPQQVAPQPTGPQQAAPQQVAPASGWSPPMGAYAPSQYQPTNNTARGPRYEQTGSGHF